MIIPAHILSGWCPGNLLPFSPRERLFCMLAASLPDVDALGCLVGDRWYYGYHHVLAHNVVFALALALVLGALSRRSRRVLVFGTCLGLVHLHFGMDYIASGLELSWLWPFSRHPFMYTGAGGWELLIWLNLLGTAVLLVWAVAIAVRHGRTPFEAIMPSLDRWVVAILRRQA